MLIPIGTELRTRQTPIANYAIIAVNVAVFLFTDYLGGAFGAGIKAFYCLDAARPRLHQYLTYQFLHGDVLHLAGNMLFLWIFGNAVCDRMGSVGYALFYLAAGVFAGVAFALGAENPILGASGAIAGVTTAFLVLFPRVHVTMLVWMFFIFTFQVPATILIVFKIILWDNIVAPSFDHGAASNVAYSAHLGGYLFGFLTSLVLLVTRAIPRHQFDILAVWQRRARQQGWEPLTAGGPVVARPVRVEELDSRPLDSVTWTPAERLRAEVREALDARDMPRAVHAYEGLQELDPGQVLPGVQQVAIANYLAQQREYQAAARVYETFLEGWPGAPEAPEVRLFLGLIRNRYLNDPAGAARHLKAALDGRLPASQQALAMAELDQALARLRDQNGGDAAQTREDL